MASDIPIKDPEKVARTTAKLPVLSELGFTPSDDKMFAAWNPGEKELYAGILDVTAGDLHIYKANDLLSNDWEDVSGGGHDFGTASRLSTPLVTESGSLIVSEDGNNQTWRFSDWEKSPTQTGSFGGLYTRHAQDNNGDIYIGEYFGLGGSDSTNKNVHKSTDDGQTWSSVHTSSHDGHMHGVVPSPARDIMLIAWGDDTGDLEFANKDGASSGTVNVAGNADTDRQAIGAIPIGMNRGLSNAEEEFITIGDDDNYAFSRTYANFGGSPLNSLHRYTVGGFEENVDRKPHITDIIHLPEGGFMANGLKGVYHSPDGWRWDKVMYAPTQRSGPPWEQAIARIPGGYAVPMGSHIWVVPSDAVQSWDPSPSQTYALIEGGASGVSSGDSLMRGLPTERYSKVLVSGRNGAAGDAVRVRDKSAPPKNATGALDTTVDFASGNKGVEVTLYGSNLEIDAQSALQDTAEIHVKLVE